MTKKGDNSWVSVATGAADARDKLRRADALLVSILVAEVTNGATHTWAEMEKLKQSRQLVLESMNCLTMGLKGRKSTGKSRLSVVK